MHYEARLNAMQREEILRELSLLLGRENTPGRCGLPSFKHFVSVAERGATMETSMEPLLFLLFRKNPQGERERIQAFVTAQTRLIQAGIEDALKRRDKSLRTRTQTMRRYLQSYAIVQHVLQNAAQSDAQPPQTSEPTVVSG